jgi:hypothetical protein
MSDPANLVILHLRSEECLERKLALREIYEVLTHGQWAIFKILAQPILHHFQLALDASVN